MLVIGPGPSGGPVDRRLAPRRSASVSRRDRIAVRNTLVVMSLFLLTTPALVAVPDARPAEVAANPKLIGGWYAAPEIDGKKRGLWIELAADGTWRRIQDHFGFRAEDHGRWLPDGDGIRLGEGGMRLRFADGRLVDEYLDKILYRLEPCQVMPKELAALPAFPRTLSETMAVLAAELPERHRVVIAGSVQGDLMRFHDGLGTYIRNRFGLDGYNTALLAACKAQGPDDAATVILRALRDHLRQTRPGGRELGRLERLLGEITMPPIQVRHMTLPELVARLNREIHRALRRDGRPEDALVCELAPARSDQERQHWLNGPAILRPWRKVETADVSVELTDLLSGFHKWLEGPNRLVLEPSEVLRGLQSPQTSPDFSSARWRNDWFEIATSTAKEASGLVRFDSWLMMGPSPPMPVEAAVRYAGIARERATVGKGALQIRLSGDRVVDRQDGWLWSYVVESALTGEGSPGVFSDLEGYALERSRWPDLRRPPRLSFDKALARFRTVMSKRMPGRVPSRPTHVEMALCRLSLSTTWYYAIALFGENQQASGYVTLDGQVIWSVDNIEND